jgi:peptidoglycan/LPS O-acetylase OafA/YrhL
VTSHLPEVATKPVAPRKSAHLYYVDMVRVLTVALVISVHVLALEPIPTTLATGALLTVMHVSREVFFLLTAFVLTYGYRSRSSVRWPSFWRKRYLFVAVPYVVWTVVYFFADQPRLDPAGPALRLFTHELLIGTARYHLYFLLVSMQIYLVFPLLRQLLRMTGKHHRALLVVSAVYQLAFYLAVQQGWSLGPLSGWLRTPDALLPSYLGFIVAGAVAAWHTEALVRWTRANIGRVYAGCAASIALGVGVFLAEVLIGGQGPLTASAVFQPVVVVESVGIAWGFLATGLLWQERGRPGSRVVLAGSDSSFGIYLSHPLLLQALLAGSAAVGLTSVAQRAPSGLVIAIELVIVVPALYLAAGLLSSALRRTPMSLPLTGRARLRRRPASTTTVPAATPRPVAQPTDRPVAQALPTSGGSR